MDEFAEDYADRTVHEIDKLVMAFCNPLGGTVDEALVKHVYAKVRSIFVDGALVKVAQYLRATKMPNVVLICRDPGHMLRIAMKDPLIRSNRFGAQHERLFGKSGLLRQVQFSDGLQARLEECQRIVLRHAGHQGGNFEARDAALLVRSPPLRVHERAAAKVRVRSACGRASLGRHGGR